jgi:hypothetical protein
MYRQKEKNIQQTNKKNMKWAKGEYGIKIHDVQVKRNIVMTDHIQDHSAENVHIDNGSRLDGEDNMMYSVLKEVK